MIGQAYGILIACDWWSGNGLLWAGGAALVTLLLIWRWYRQYIRMHTLPVSGGTPDAPDTEAPPELVVPDGPGTLLVRFQELDRQLGQAVQDLQHFNGNREAQLQGWQQLSAEIMRRIVPVLDNLEPYLRDDESPGADVARMAHGRLLTELATLGVSRIIPQPGDDFDGKYHQVDAASSGLPPYRITAVVAPGYLFRPRVAGANELVVKPAEVVVESADARMASAATEEA